MWFAVLLHGSPEVRPVVDDETFLEGCAQRALVPKEIGRVLASTQVQSGRDGLGPVRTRAQAHLQPHRGLVHLFYQRAPLSVMCWKHWAFP